MLLLPHQELPKAQCGFDDPEGGFDQPLTAFYGFDVLLRSIVSLLGVIALDGLHDPALLIGEIEPYLVWGTVRGWHRVISAARL